MALWMLAGRRTGRGKRSSGWDRGNQWIDEKAMNSLERPGPGPRISILARGALRCRIGRPNTRQDLITLPGVSKENACIEGASIHDSVPYLEHNPPSQRQGRPTRDV